MTGRSFSPYSNRRHNDNGPDQLLNVARPDPTKPGAQTWATITVRQAGHDDWDTICDHWTNIAQAAADTSLLAPGIGGEHGGTTSTTTSDDARSATYNQQQAEAWCRERDNLIAQLTRLAQRANIVDPPAVKAKKTVTERCVKCRQEIDPKADDGKAHTVDGHRLHAKTCYLQVWRDARDQGITIGYMVNQLAENVKTVETAGR